MATWPWPNTSQEAREINTEQSEIKILNDKHAVKRAREFAAKTKETVNYCLNRWENLESFIKYPEATFSTNAAERSIKSWGKSNP